VRGEVASFGADLLLLLAGFGVLSTIGIRPAGALSTVGLAGLAYLAGSAIVPLALTLMLVIGVPFTVTTFLMVVIVCIAVGIWQGWGSFSWRPKGTAGGLGLWRSWSIDTWVIVTFVVAFAGFGVVGLLNALETPMIEGDAWTIWARKTQVLTEHNSLWLPFFKNPVYGFAHLDYPLQVPIFEAIHSRVAGSFDTQALIGHLWLLLLAFIWAAAYLAHVFGRVRPIVWAPVLLLVATAPAVWQQSSGNADLPMAMFVCIGVLAAAIWLRDGDRRILMLAAVMLATAANTKNEGTAAAAATFIALGLVTLIWKQERRAFVFAGGFIVVFGILPWRLWLSHEHIKTDVQTGKILDPGYLIEHFDRVWPTIKAIGLQLAEQGRWAYIVPLASAFLVAALISGIGRRIALFYLVSLILSWASFVMTYWVSAYELSWYLETSVPRIVTVLVLICAAAVVHLSGLFLMTLGRPFEGAPPNNQEASTRVAGANG
jgi:hypothetical protein